MSVELIRANARNLPIADSSVDLIVTSPPYFGLRSYQDGGKHYEGQVGAEATPAEFVDALIEAQHLLSTGAIPPDPLAPAHRKALSDALKGKTP